jgi:hypothetical protein
MSSTAKSCAVLSPVVITTSHHSDDQAGGNTAKHNPANRREHCPADTSVNSSTEDESRHRGNRQSGEGFVPDVLIHIPVPHHAIG